MYCQLKVQLRGLSVKRMNCNTILSLSPSHASPLPPHSLEKNKIRGTCEKKITKLRDDDNSVEDFLNI